ncbi:Rop family plasmid primer RNA-binding protein, partial [Klebsiella pneumoniae]|uniref:Rop family plasmid primer RNA-binding protein n=1 Tax=Klebsiella pneumoniae TaxID=573 RepID=UPI0020A677A4
KFIKEQSLLLLDKLNELDMDTPADMCERLHEDAETLWQVMREYNSRYFNVPVPELPEDKPARRWWPFGKK